MRLLFDQNLSRHLVDQLAAPYPDSVHVVGIGLAAASDQEIWAYAGRHDYIIASKDSDFRQLAFLLGAPPRAIWLRAGNVSTSSIADVLRRSVHVVESFATSVDEVLLVLPGLDD